MMLGNIKRKLSITPEIQEIDHLKKTKPTSVVELTQFNQMRGDTDIFGIGKKLSGNNYRQNENINYPLFIENGQGVVAMATDKPKTPAVRRTQSVRMGRESLINRKPVPLPYTFMAGLNDHVVETPVMQHPATLTEKCLRPKEAKVSPLLLRLKLPFIRKSKAKNRAQENAYTDLPETKLDCDVKRQGNDVTTHDTSACENQFELADIKKVGDIYGTFRLKNERIRPEVAPPLPFRRRPGLQEVLIKPPPESGIKLEKVLRLDKFMTNKWISGLAVTKKNEYIVVDLREAYLIDEDGNLKKVIGGKGANKLQEPIDVTVANNGNLVFSDHSQQDVKVFNWRGQFLYRVKDKSLTNIAGVATNEDRNILIAGTDKRQVSIHSEDDHLICTIPSDQRSKCPFEHPYSIAVNPLSGDIVVGDDYKQLVSAVSKDGRVLWRFSPPGDRQRHFFPSSICVDSEGYIFVADLYNEKVYMLDSSGKFIKTVLSPGDGLKGAPGAIATDGKGRLLVADEEKTIKVFKYGENGFALYRRTSYNPDSYS